eukprot:CAMPEP_0115505538 /NCGR_PEP_ID=MMETSP0271-20121206/70634_1 /TAXON_ID=71861 /ORGANISM="Scrippsiella trochoidea, Strain CCMP3099" /LENGTH=221 /DNA_ID=CAMNT_0002934845 /DNA_START=92 /DNA_END=755 /DNA_ORIENTATION=-
MMKPFAGMAIKQIKDNRGVPSSLFGIPLQVGPGSEHVKALQHWLWGAIGAQAIMGVIQVVCLSDYLGAVEMFLTVAIGYWAVSEEMNITYTCLWGACCLLFMVLGALALLILSLLSDVLSLDVISMILEICVPVVYLFGFLLAVHFYHLWAQANHMPDIPAALDPIGKFVDDHDPLDVKRTGSDALVFAQKAATEYTPLVRDAVSRTFSGEESRRSSKIPC